MHTSRVVMKDGKTRTGIIWSVGVQEGWFTLIEDGEDDATIQIADCASVVTYGERISINKIGDQDMLAKWAKDKEWADQNPGRGGG